MFDIGFFELLVIAIVGLLVIGPERLPETVRAIGLWIGRLKRSLRETRSELEKQIGADDIRRQLHNEEVMRSLESTRRQIEDAVQEGALPQDSPPRRKNKYREEEELPNHAHTQEASVEKPSPNEAAASAREEPSADREPSAGNEPSADKKSSADNTTSKSEASARQGTAGEEQASSDKAANSKNHSQTSK